MSMCPKDKGPRVYVLSSSLHIWEDMGFPWVDPTGTNSLVLLYAESCLYSKL
jgi:hypothetical protein